MSAKTERRQVLDQAMLEINKESPDLIVRGSDILYDTLPRITSGSLGFDVALGGGWPANQWHEVLGHESNGKTTILLKTIAANQALDPDWLVLWVAAEEFVVEWAQQLGVDVDRVLVAETNVMEEAYSVAIKMAERHLVDCIVIDSLPALVPLNEFETPKGKEAGIEESQPGVGARLTNKFTRLARKASRRSLVRDERPVTGFIVNQWREKIGVTFGDPRITPGGKGKNFFYFTRVEVARDEWIKEPKEDPVGLVIRIKTIKNKSAPSQRVAMVNFYFADHEEFIAGDYDVAKDVFDVALTLGIIEKRGNNYIFGDDDDPKQLKVLGKPAMLEALEDAELRAEVTEWVMETVTAVEEVE